MRGETKFLPILNPVGEIIAVSRERSIVRGSTNRVTIFGKNKDTKSTKKKQEQTENPGEIYLQGFL